MGAFALALRNTVTEVRQLFFTTTCVITISTVIINGGMTVPVLTFLQIPVGISDDEQEELLGGNGSDEMENSVGTSGGSSGNFSSNGGKKSCMARIWRGLDSNFMKPLLTSSRPSLVETLPNFLLTLCPFFNQRRPNGIRITHYRLF